MAIVALVALVGTPAFAPAASLIGRWRMAEEVDTACDTAGITVWLPLVALGMKDSAVVVFMDDGSWVWRSASYEKRGAYIDTTSEGCARTLLLKHVGETEWHPYCLRVLSETVIEGRPMNKRDPVRFRLERR